MNPFLYSTVVKPSKEPLHWHINTQAKAASASRSRFLQRSRKLLKTTAQAAGVAALAWSGAAFALDVNSASLAQLKGIRGIGPKTAQIIIAERNRAGRFQSLSDLSDRVRGIGPRKLQALQAAGLNVGAPDAIPDKPASVTKK